MKGNSLAAAVFLANVLGATAPVAAQTPINVSYQVTIHGIPLQIADDKNWWTEIGLKPGDMTSFAAGAQQIAAVASKSWDVGLMGGPPALLGASRFNVQTVLILIDDSRANGVVAKGDQAAAILANPVAALKGREYLVPANSTADYAAQSCFRKWGLQPGDVKAVNIAPGALVDAFKSSNVPIGAIWAPHFLRMETQAGGKLVCTGQDGGATVTANLVVRDDYLKSNMDTVARFTALYLRALDFMKKNKAETLVAMKKFYDKGGVVLSPSEMDAEYTSRDYFDLAQQVALFDRSKGPSKLDDIHNRLAEFFKAAGTIPAVLDPKTYVNPDVLAYIEKDAKLKAFAEGK
jgi:ABC-type nitrate/sulfonate/bicarbonate transport system substrate-binding protein